MIECHPFFPFHMVLKSNWDSLHSKGNGEGPIHGEDLIFYVSKGVNGVTSFKIPFYQIWNGN